MSLGLGGKLPVLQRSPLDLDAGAGDAPPPPPPITAAPGEVRWLPSRYNVRAVTTDGRLVLWNGLRGTMSVFPAAQRLNIVTLLGQKGFAAPLRGAVKFLHERGFLIKEGTDEYRRIQLGFGQEHYRTDVLQLILLASEDCNFRCTYCYEDFARGTMQPWVRAAIKKLVETRIGNLRSLSVGWFGGEPLYGFEAIEDLAPFFIEIARERSVQFASHMTTNGYLLTPDVAAKLLAWGIVRYQITIDGLPEDHDRNRPTRDGQGSFATILENLKAMAELPEDYSVDIRFNFDPQNSRSYREFLDVIQRELGDDERFRLRFRAIGKWGGPNDENLSVCGVDDIWGMEREMKREARRRGLAIAEELRHVHMGSNACYASRPYNFVVGASGKLMKCTVDLDKHDRNVVGHLHPDGRMELDQDKLALWTEPAFEHDAKCRKCVILPVCQGIYCPQIRMDTGDSRCSPLRSQVKHELLEAVEGGHQAAPAVLRRGAAVAAVEERVFVE
jgi:uncharacterized protein